MFTQKIIEHIAEPHQVSFLSVLSHLTHSASPTNQCCPVLSTFSFSTFSAKIIKHLTRKNDMNSFCCTCREEPQLFLHMFSTRWQLLQVWDAVTGGEHKSCGVWGPRWWRSWVTQLKFALCRRPRIGSLHVWCCPYKSKKTIRGLLGSWGLVY